MGKKKGIRNTVSMGIVKNTTPKMFKDFLLLISCLSQKVQPEKF
jgi:hypothetical protein